MQTPIKIGPYGFKNKGYFFKFPLFSIKYKCLEVVGSRLLIKNILLNLTSNTKDEKQSVMKIWKLSYGRNIFNESQVESCLRERKIILNKGTPGKGSSNKSQFEDFSNSEKYDVVYTCYGNNKILHLGIITDNAVKEVNSDSKSALKGFESDWVYRNYKLLAEAYQNSGYEGSERKWWLPTDNSTYTEVKVQELNLFEEEILKPFFGIDLNLLYEKIETMKQSLSMESYKRIMDTASQQLIFQGPPGTGKTREAKKLANWLVSNGSETGQAGDNTKVDTLQLATDNGQIQFTQFHPAYNYDDFIRGLVPQKGNDGSISFEPQDKVLLQIAKKARKYPETTYVLIIDEINRANLPEVMGELIYALEYRGEPFNVVYPESFESGNYQEYIPDNLYIIGTMNTADRSVGTLDYAIRRRFVFERLLPDRKVITSEKAENLFKKVEKLFDQENEEYNCYLSPEFDKNDVMLGHSYFLAEDDDQLSINLEYKIKPILREYVKDGVLIDNQNGEEALRAIDNVSNEPTPLHLPN